MLTALSNMNRVLFEPFWIVGLWGIILVLFCFREVRQTKVFVPLFGCLAIGILWRLAIAIPSSRYASVLLYPAVIFTIVGIYGTRVPLFVARIIFIVIAAICLGKNFRFNEYSQHLQLAGAAIRKDSAAYRSPIVLDFCEEHSRLRYYTSFRTIHMRLNPKLPQELQIAANLRQFGFDHDVIYVVLKKKSSDGLSAEQIAVPESQWKQLFSSSMDNRKKKYIFVYRYLILQKEYKTIRSVADISKNQALNAVSQLPNGDFSNTVNSPLSLEELLPFWYKMKDIPPSENAKLKLTVGAWGLPALLMTGTEPIGLVRPAAELFSLADEYFLQVAAAATPGSRFFIRISIYQQDGTMGKAFSIIFEPESNEVRLYSIPILPVPEDSGAKFKISIGLENGEVFWYDLALSSK